MANPLPTPVSAYLAAVTPQEFADCFAEDGVASDQRQTYRGRDAILDWREEVGQISYRQDVLSSRQDGDGLVVTCRIAGDFKGSPVELDYAFRLVGDRIASLDIS